MLEQPGPWFFREVDPQHTDALALLREAAIEARVLYPDLFAADAPWPGNDPTPERGVYLIAYRQGHALASGALQPLSQKCAEIRRMYVHSSVRRQGLASAMLAQLEAVALDRGFGRLCLETGNRQCAAIALYTASGYRPTVRFGPYRNDPVSVCFAKRLTASSDGSPTSSMGRQKVVN